MLVGNGSSSKFMYNALSSEFNVVGILIDEAVSSNIMIKRRVKRLGYCTVLGQLFFIAFTKVLSRYLSRNVSDICTELKLIGDDFPQGKIIFKGNLNSPESVSIIQSSCVDVVVVNGTRILSADVINSLDADFINTHVGITPKYRGVHGGYWALANGDEPGVTVHLIDTGIDTGGVLFQGHIEVNNNDNFLTYPYKQLAIAIPLMIRAINNSYSNSNEVHKSTGKSKLWYHPTICQYIYNYMKKGVK